MDVEDHYRGDGAQSIQSGVTSLVEEEERIHADMSLSKTLLPVHWGRETRHGRPAVGEAVAVAIRLLRKSMGKALILPI
ncbi:hypothetical protein [Fundidesulfovibrio putealis]|uniref:hypothetical protein n=1 Tax=Fundidesulfovibrio putealis TaxID=270496 RepID=UPI00146FBE09|nr:hypothetical protein [Fundidesulfovibrio putealis]